MRPHRDVALDQLRNADSHAGSAEQQHLNFLVGSLVHAILDMGDAMRCEPHLDPVWDFINGTKDA